VPRIDEENHSIYTSGFTVLDDRLHDFDTHEAHLGQSHWFLASPPQGSSDTLRHLAQTKGCSKPVCNR
jgi:hypothetical protein